MDCLVSDLHDHPQNAFFFDPMEGQKWDEFLESIKESGVIEPLIITQDNVIVSGHQRKAACLELGIQTVPCVVRQYEDHDDITKDEWIIKDLIDTNVQQRGAIGGSELKAIRRVDALRGIYKLKHGGNRSTKSKCAERALAQQPPSIDEICAEAGSTRRAYSHYRCLQDMPEEMLSLLDVGELTVTVAADIARRLSPEEQEILFSMLPASQKITSKIIEPMVEEIEKLRADNAFFMSDEDATSRRIDEVDLEAKAIRDENERIKSGRGTDAEIDLRRERDEARSFAAQLEEKNRIIEASLKRQKALRIADSELGRTAEQQVFNLCNLILTTATPLAELPTSVFFKLSAESRRELVDIITRSIDGLDEIRNLLSGIAEAG